ncbi:MAG: peptidoglycan bridge formation glycyltransferase FemA/FemB family protein [Actinomycetaceae bacterium]|nr:peptidoglycan bridge formation glycyltransferase FemA/FemB family protein [Actinomycetaceae bacterium]
MRFAVLTPEAYQNFVENTDHRVFIPQLPEFARVRANHGYRVEYVGIVDGEDDAVVGAGVVVYQPWKRFFFRAQLGYGPLLDWDDARAITCFFEGLKDHLIKDRRVLVLRFNPLVARAFYEDIEVREENENAKAVVRQLTDLGAMRLTKEFYEQSDVQIRFIYTKDIEGLSFDEAIGTLAKGLRRRFRNEGRYGVTTSFLPPEDFDVFDSLHESTAERTTMEEMTDNVRNLYRDLMTELGPERALLCVARLSPSLYLSQIADERAQAQERIATLEERKATKARDRELKELDQRLATLAANEEQARQTAQEHGEDIPFNAALCFRIGKELILLLGGMDKRFAAYARDYPVERAMFKWACDHGLSTYNTFGISGIFDDSAPDAPVLAFKRWLNGNVEEFVGTFVIPMRKNLAKALSALE